MSNELFMYIVTDVEEKKGDYSKQKRNATR
jgi:hypothetical protein